MAKKKREEVIGFISQVQQTHPALDIMDRSVLGIMTTGTASKT
jgi:hypothetical protein